MANITQEDRTRAESFNRDLRCILTGTQLHNLAGFFARHREAAIKQRDAEIVAMPAFHNLRHNQKQADMDGVSVTVSRQALDEVLDAIERGEVPHGR